MEVGMTMSFVRNDAPAAVGVRRRRGLGCRVVVEANTNWYDVGSPSVVWLLPLDWLPSLARHLRNATRFRLS